MVTIERKNEIDKRLASIGEELAAISKEVGRNVLASATPHDDWDVTILEGAGETTTHYTLKMYGFSDAPRSYVAMTQNGEFSLHDDDLLPFLNWREGAKDE